MILIIPLAFLYLQPVHPVEFHFEPYLLELEQVDTTLLDTI